MAKVHYDFFKLRADNFFPLNIAAYLRMNKGLDKPALCHNNNTWDNEIIYCAF